MTSVFRAIRAFPRFVWDVAKLWYNGGIGDLAAGVTFWILITVPAAVLALVSSASFLDQIVGTSIEGEIQFQLLEFVNSVFAEGASTAREAVRNLFDQPQTGVFTIAAGLTLFTISRGFAGMIRALDSVYDVENGRPWYHTRFVGLILGLGSILVIVAIVTLEVLVWGDENINPPFEGPLSTAVSMAILVYWGSMIFHFGPSTRSKWRWDLPGAFVAAVFWSVLSLGFNRYVRLFSLGSDSSDVLGIIGGFILALTWIWLAAQVLLIGAAVNQVLGERFNLDRGRRKSVLNAALSNATGELKKVVVNGSRTGEGAGEFSPKAVAQRLNPSNRARSLVDLRTDETAEMDLRQSQRVG